MYDWVILGYKMWRGVYLCFKELLFFSAFALYFSHTQLVQRFFPYFVVAYPACLLFLFFFFHT